MGTNPTFGPRQLKFGTADTGTMTGTTTITTQAIDCGALAGIGFQVSWTSTPTGTFQFQDSVDGVTYFDIGASGWVDPAGASGSFRTDIVGRMGKYIRLSYTNASGSGVLTVKAFGRHVGV